MPFLIGLRAKRVFQTLPRRLTPSVEWEPLREGVQVRFKTRYGQYLRANGWFPPWRGHITHDIPYRSVTQDWILWDVEILEDREDEALPRLLPPPISKNNIESSSDDHGSPSEKGNKVRGGRKNGDVNATIGERRFTFKGSGVEELNKMLKEKTGVDEEFTICSRNPLNGKLYPLRLHLPPNISSMHDVVVPQSSKGAKDLGSS
ncbi:putative Tetratricopeptide repeat (TPR)-like superfamily protein [Hibiscus syriacus]|uniref:Tetratricopeptide repeat (TPR)-like superfamily protein n=1 Tax=Hibiscus syriacus TaxID=106335 RepID=A0A6A3AQ16_HIBSY|nr:putative Tetratricopeptide repeat (TPR)-like superfamily protein [Hibiscus syriacus]